MENLVLVAVGAVLGIVGYRYSVKKYEAFIVAQAAVIHNRSVQG